MDDSQDFAALQERISAALVATTKTVGRIAAEDLTFQRSLDPSFGRAVNKQSARLLALADTLVKTAVAGSDLDGLVLREVDDLDTSWKGVVDVVDSLLERADTCLDEYTGVVKRLGPEQQAQSDAVRHPTSP